MSLTLQKKKTVRRPDDGPPGPPQKSQRANAPSKETGRAATAWAVWSLLFHGIVFPVVIMTAGFSIGGTPQPTWAAEHVAGPIVVATGALYTCWFWRGVFSSASS